MTAPSRDGRDGPFSDWLRNHRDLHSSRYSLYACDIDMMFFRFKPVVDKVGSRDLKLTMDVEIKTFGAYPKDEQMELLFFKHQLRAKKKMYSTFLKRNVGVWHFGQFVLRIFGGDRPDKCDSMNWCCFTNKGILDECEIQEETLTKILKFDIAPDDKEDINLSTRRHHKTVWTYYTDTSGLFPVERLVVKRS